MPGLRASPQSHTRKRVPGAGSKEHLPGEGWRAAMYVPSPRGRFTNRPYEVPLRPRRGPHVEIVPQNGLTFNQG